MPHLDEVRSGDGRNVGEAPFFIVGRGEAQLRESLERGFA
jgi:hypothetical protein